MNPIEKMNISALVASILLLLSFPVIAAGIDDITNYQPPPKGESPHIVEPYTANEIIAIVPDHLDDRGIYDQRDMLLWDNPKAKAFDEYHFGKCTGLYISVSPMGSKNRIPGGWYNPYGSKLLQDVLIFSFPKNEEDKINAASRMKYDLNQIEQYNFRRDGCTDLPPKITQLKMLLDDIIQAAPSILQEKQRMVKEKMARIATEKQSKEEHTNELKACQNTNQYKLYEISKSIEINKAIAKNAQLEMQRQEEGAKISGLVDKRVMYEMGNRIAGVNRLNKENFEAYNKLGGSAKNIESVHGLPNPCNM